MEWREAKPKDSTNVAINLQNMVNMLNIKTDNMKQQNYLTVAI